MSSPEAIQSHKGDERYVRADEQGQFTDDQVDTRKSLATARRTPKTVVPEGQEDCAGQKS